MMSDWSPVKVPPSVTLTKVSPPLYVASCASPVAQPDVEALVDVTLVQKAGGVAVAQESAVLAYVAGAGGGPITVRAMAAQERELARLQEPRVYAVDPAWLSEAGESGYDIAWPMYVGLKIILR